MIENVFPEIVSELKVVSLVIPITDTVVTTWIIILILAVISYLTTRRLSISQPSKIQIFAERIVIAIEQTLENSVNISAWILVPFIGTIWIYVGFMNLISLIPYFHNPTRDLSTTAALSVIVFFQFTIMASNLAVSADISKKYIEPSIFLLPFNLFADVSRIFAMAIRLFGNMLSWEMIVAILIALVGFLVPVPMILLSIVGDVLHAFLFGLLTYIFIIAGIQVEELKSTKEKKMDSMTIIVAVSIITAGLTIAIGGYGPSRGEAEALTKAIETIGRQPESANEITRLLFVGMAMVESVAIYSLVIALIILFANPLLDIVGK